MEWAAVIGVIAGYATAYALIRKEWQDVISQARKSNHHIDAPLLVRRSVLFRK